MSHIGAYKMGNWTCCRYKFQWLSGFNPYIWGCEWWWHQHWWWQWTSVNEEILGMGCQRSWRMKPDWSQCWPCHWKSNVIIASVTRWKLTMKRMGRCGMWGDHDGGELGGRCKATHKPAYVWSTHLHTIQWFFQKWFKQKCTGLICMIRMARSCLLITLIAW